MKIIGLVEADLIREPDRYIQIILKSNEREATIEQEKLYQRMELKENPRFRFEFSKHP